MYKSSIAPTCARRVQVCCAAFCPTNCNVLALGTAACQMRVYDIRRLDAPLAAITAPRAVSYVRIVGPHIFASVVNSTVQMHDLSALMNGKPAPVVREFKGHVNERNFVGLAVNAAGYVFSGSETNEVAMYHASVPAALAKRAIEGADASAAGMDGGGKAERPIVSCVAVGKAANVVVAGGTTGWVNVMRLV
jgi:hypothetical protein